MSTQQQLLDAQQATNDLTIENQRLRGELVVQVEKLQSAEKTIRKLREAECDYIKRASRRLRNSRDKFLALQRQLNRTKRDEFAA